MIFSVTDTLTICRHKILCGFRQAFPNTKADSDTIYLLRHYGGARLERRMNWG